jgi:hypothetical protein
MPQPSTSEISVYRLRREWEKSYGIIQRLHAPRRPTAVSIHAFAVGGCAFRSNQAFTSAHRTIAAVIARPHAMPRRSTPRQAMSASSASAEINRTRVRHERGSSAWNVRGPHHAKRRRTETPRSAVERQFVVVGRIGGIGRRFRDSRASAATGASHARRSRQAEHPHHHGR